MVRFQVRLASVAVSAMAVAPAFAVVNPFTETFSSSAANWAIASTGPGVAPLTYSPSGGPDGSGFGSGSFSFTTASVGAFPILFRSQSSFGSSGNAFVGNWLASGVSDFSFSVRHNFTSPVTFFARFVAASPAVTGVVYQVPVTTAPGTWATYSFHVSDTTPFIYEGAPTLFGSTFTNVDRVQIGIIADAQIAGQAGPFTFDVDNVSIVPAPGAAAMLGLAGLVASRRRRG